MIILHLICLLAPCFFAGTRVQSTPFALRKTYGAEKSSVICPDGRSQCPFDNTCCEVTSGKYGCCPFSDAVCCSHHVHCCPSGYTCDLATGTCNETGGSDPIPLFRKNPSSKIDNLTNVVCPGGKVQCPDEQTCCLQKNDSYGCCPMPNAVCCPDHIHCCPNDYYCDASTGTCTDKRETLSIIPLLKMNPFKKTNEEMKDIMCPGGKRECPDGNTCCQLSSGEYGCCPLPNAVCCPDRIRCCPEGTTCSLTGCDKK